MPGRKKGATGKQEDESTSPSERLSPPYAPATLARDEVEPAARAGRLRPEAPVELLLDLAHFQIVGEPIESQTDDLGRADVATVPLEQLAAGPVQPTPLRLRLEVDVDPLPAPLSAPRGRGRLQTPRDGVPRRLRGCGLEVALDVALGHPLLAMDRLVAEGLTDPAGSLQVVEDGLVAEEAG